MIASERGGLACGGKHVGSKGHSQKAQGPHRAGDDVQPRRLQPSDFVDGAADGRERDLFPFQLQRLVFQQSVLVAVV